jgi:hypothetical protein
MTQPLAERTKANPFVSGMASLRLGSPIAVHVSSCSTPCTPCKAAASPRTFALRASDATYAKKNAHLSIA